jgi:hypothetical protein
MFAAGDKKNNQLSDAQNINVDNTSKNIKNQTRQIRGGVFCHANSHLTLTNNVYGLSLLHLYDDKKDIFFFFLKNLDCGPLSFSNLGEARVKGVLRLLYV